jgi:lysine 2,3-aminomutase
LRVDLETGRALVSELRATVSGLCQPAYVLDIPGGHGKVPVGPDHLRPGGVVDHVGRTHPYP